MADGDVDDEGLGQRSEQQLNVCSLWQKKIEVYVQVESYRSQCQMVVV